MCRFEILIYIAEIFTLASVLHKNVWLCILLFRIYIWKVSLQWIFPLYFIAHHGYQTLHLVAVDAVGDLPPLSIMMMLSISTFPPNVNDFMWFHVFFFSGDDEDMIGDPHLIV